MPAETSTIADEFKASTKKTYIMPTVYLGESVIYHRGGKDSAAFVTEVGSRNVSLYILPPGAVMGDVRHGVRHHNDPDITLHQKEQVGTWRHNERTKQFAELMEPIAAGK